MGFRISGTSDLIEANLERNQRVLDTSTQRISSGVRFTRNDPMPAEQALSSALTAKEHELNIYKRNASDGLSLTQYADANLNEIANIVLRMKELVTQATSPALSDRERAYLFVEYQGLYGEVDRIAKSTRLNGASLLDGSQARDSQNLGFRVGPSTMNEDGTDVSVITIPNFNKIDATAKGMSLASMASYMPNDVDDGLALDDMLSAFDVDNSEELVGLFDKIQSRIGFYRASFGAATSRLIHSMDSIETAQENVAAANSRIKDIDYATEITNLVRAQILQHAGTSMLIQQESTGRSLVELLERLPS